MVVSKSKVGIKRKDINEYFEGKGMVAISLVVFLRNLLNMRKQKGHNFKFFKRKCRESSAIFYTVL